MLHVLIVDDEALARQRLRFLLESLSEFPCVVQEAASVAAAQQHFKAAQVDLMLLDIQMPGTSGIEWARALQAGKGAPVVVFVTAHAEFAAEAFDLQAADYLTKPVRLERLRQALRRAMQLRPDAAMAAQAVAAQPPQEDFLCIQDRHRTVRVPIQEVLCCRAELKYVTVVTASRQYLLDESLNGLQQRFPQHFLRVHRSALVARGAMRGLVRSLAPQDGECWSLTLAGTTETVPVARRMLATVRAQLRGSSVA
ncbi:hypothetical protein AAV94_10165 [Lampropedia cohaerens]|uniref:LytTR family transcriptional regulator n=1 Tax=Lampropedia cohaerens TaxID=1610491 RepID=A0A0U1PYG2_9BURK|nr:LytTR family DNA-binding domain-containing protein [Lampropedia cohaerens]KKW67554.1 hypothetical protein AAV94_10165 [Lampropedia cohaerens]